MIAKIGRGNSLYGALSYNQLKVDKENGQVLLTHKMLETPSGSYTVSYLLRSFEPYLIANRNTEKPVLHISLNPDPRDNVSDEKYKLMAQEYMQEMGYGEQPFVVFKHTDIDRTHIHIVSVCVDEDGKKISDKFEKVRSMKACRNIEKQFGLIPAIGKEEKQDGGLQFHPVDYKRGNIKSQIASIVRHLPQYYQYQTLGQYNALLSLFNITAEKIEGELHGQTKKGLIYSALNTSGEKASPAFKASLFGKGAGYEAQNKHFTKCKGVLKESKAKHFIRENIATALKSTDNEQDFKKALASRGINTVIRHNDDGTIYGVTFIDHHSKTVWNGSQLGKEFSANIFNDRWKDDHRPNFSITQEKNAPFNHMALETPASSTNSNSLFDFLDRTEPTFLESEHGFIEIIGGLLPEVQQENYSENDFDNMMKKKKRKRKRNQ
ncbi:relaxase/mobilization nuclease domain-containing protein [Chryseobacterium paludis]|uniref:relaxase/mobilization nuclease domain-containing protein n=1 Tax=Chryseobacterium paludis TaxID=2956784 RepID=UPI0021C09ECE|nr:relaxase/mobilization nuclease domain-containing protein [Chryseobacterium paludis]